jgi:ABC-2 type transport system ATP-binding protein
MSLLQVNEISKTFGYHLAVDKISFSADRGEVVGFLGPNGAGKSTTMKIITGFLPPTSGDVIIAGLNIGHFPMAIKEILGYLPEGAPAYPDMTVRKFLNFIAELRGFRGEFKRQKIQEVVKKTNIESVLEQTIDTLSKGFNRRVGLAQAIIHDPEILILDEPTDGLDPNQKHEVRNLIRAMAKNKVIILSTHILEEVEAVCNRAIIIAEGKLLADSTPEKLIQQSVSYNAVNVRVRNIERDLFADILRTIDSIREIEFLTAEDNEIFASLYPKPGCCLINDLNTIFFEKKLEVVHMATKDGLLDDVFRSITQQYKQVS